MPECFFPDMRLRNTTDKEIMDRADADPDRLHRTIRQFQWINPLFSASRTLLREHFFSYDGSGSGGVTRSWMSGPVVAISQYGPPAKRGNGV